MGSAAGATSGRWDRNRIIAQGFQSPRLAPDGWTCAGKAAYHVVPIGPESTFTAKPGEKEVE
ncbi:MAG: hypothetical protein EA424_06480 [Planctomycetaceae bacterium]|nr:MAG: hypothetical protein EA424_06480 [Planctomycetaceae bacterium]